MNAAAEGLLDGTSPGTETAAGGALGAVLARVDLLLGKAVQTATATFGVGPGADPFRGLYISDADAARLVERGVEPMGRRFTFDRPLVDLEVAGPRWRRLAHAFDLSQAEVDIVALALVPEVDLRYERIFGYLHDDVTRRRPTADLALQLLCRSFEERLAGRRLLAADAALVRWGVLRFVSDPSHPDPPAIGQALRLDEGVVEFLLGDGDLDSRLTLAARLDASPGAAPSGGLAAGAVALARRLAECLETQRSAEPRHLLFAGPNEGVKLDVVHRASRELERPLLVVDLERLAGSDSSFSHAVLRALRAARLLNALPLWTRGDVLAARTDDEGAARLDAWLAAVDLTRQAGVLATAEPQPAWLAGQSHRFIMLDFPLPDAGARRVLWADRLAPLGVALPETDTTLLSEAFRFDGTAVDRAVGRAVAAAQWRDPAFPRVTGGDVFGGARAQAARVLPRYATRLAPAFGWDDIVLPADQLGQLHELCDRVRHRRTVLDDWGFARRLPLGTGVSALFAGPSGTGKTMAAQVIAQALGGLELYRVEIPAVVSKYIGDTEKALDQLFREAQGTSAILFFDEADALFGRRTEVKDAHDRYANIEVSYLLQALEAYEGLTILATNFRHNLDEAFVRRLAFIVNFPFPEAAERRGIWARSWPAATPLADDVDLEFLARQFTLAGGDIRNVALAAAFAAAADGGRVTMAHVIGGVRREYQKLGKVCAESDFGPYFPLLAGGAAR